MISLLAQVNDPNFVHGAAWIVGACSVMMTLGGAALIAQKLVINSRVIRREDVPQQVQIQNESQKRTIEMLPTLVTKQSCDERHNALALSLENLIKLRSMEQIAAYETSAKASREVLHNQISEISNQLSAVGARLDSLEQWMRTTGEKVDEISNGLSNLAGSQGKG